MGYEWRDGEERLVRNERRVNDDLRCRYEGCERMCKLRASLVRHESMMQRRVERRVRFACEDCGLEVATKGALVSHRRTCGRGQVERWAKGVWEVRGSCILHTLRPSRAVVQGGGAGGSSGGWEMSVGVAGDGEAGGADVGDWSGLMPGRSG